MEVWGQLEEMGNKEDGNWAQMKGTSVSTTSVVGKGGTNSTNINQKDLRAAPVRESEVYQSGTTPHETTS